MTKKFMVPNKIQIYTDGSALGNPGPGAWAAVILQNGKVKKRLSGAVPDTTNNRMEMQAAIEALQYFSQAKLGNALELFSDSKLLINTLTEDWKRKKNLDLWEELEAAIGDLEIKWCKVKGHANNRWNNECDELARGTAAKLKPANKLQVSSDDSVFICPKCHKKGIGKFTFLPKANLIRVDCEDCGRFIKFAKQTTANLRRVNKL